MRSLARRSLGLLIFLFSATHLSIKAQATTNAADSSSVSDSSLVHISSIKLIGNKITIDRVVLRELTFRTHDSIPFNQLEKKIHRSEENLYNTSLFNAVHINWIKEGPDISIFIILTERWYIFPIPIFEVVERNFNVWWQTRDYSRIVYGASLDWNNFRGRNEVLSLTVRLGYTQRISFYYNIPYINKNQRAGLAFGFFYSRNHSSSYASIGNKVKNFKDENRYAKKENGAYVQYAYRKSLYVTHALEAGYRNAQVLDTILEINPEYFAKHQVRERFTSLKYLFKSDHRDLVIYPLNGSYFDLEVAQQGISALGDDIQFTYLMSRYNKFWKLNRKFYFAAGAAVKVSGSKDQPYYNTRALGYGREYVRGFEYYVIDGQNFALFKTNLKFELLPKHEIHVGLIPSEKFNNIPYSFYFNLYGDAAYVNDDQFSHLNFLSNELVFGSGAGIDFVTYYDLVFRFEYSFNNLGESGFFLHFTAPI